MKNNSGVTIVELLVGLLVSAILILTVGYMSNISLRAFAKAEDESELYNDIAFGMKMIKNRVHSAGNSNSLSTATWTTGGIGYKLIVDSEAFGVYNNTDTKTKDLVYLKQQNVETNREILVSVPQNDSLNLDSTLDPSLARRYVTVKLYGNKGSVPFSLSSTVTRRIEE